MVVIIPKANIRILVVIVVIIVIYLCTLFNRQRLDKFKHTFLVPSKGLVHHGTTTHTVSQSIQESTTSNGIVTTSDKLSAHSYEKTNRAVRRELSITKIAAANGMENKMLTYLDTYRPPNRLVIIRNPWARLVSAYEDKIVRQGHPLSRYCIASKQFPKLKTTSLKTFVECIAKSDRRKVWNIHVNPYTSLCAFCHMDYNIIVKLEEMDEAESYIFQRLNFAVGLKYKPPTKGRYSNTYAGHYNNMSNDTISALREAFKLDIQLFGYPQSPFELS